MAGQRLGLTSLQLGPTKDRQRLTPDAAEAWISRFFAEALKARADQMGARHASQKHGRLKTHWQASLLRWRRRAAFAGRSRSHVRLYSGSGG
eukprot:2217947-Pleurochrysis_carterae.AAC.6